MKIHIGPGINWNKYVLENNITDRKTIDVDPNRGDYVCNFNTTFKALPFEDNSIEGIYASHIFEHVSIYVIPTLFRECYRVLKPGGFLRVITPNPVLSMKKYLENDKDFTLFQRTKKRHPHYTLFECLREDFISPTGQPELLGRQLAHQNAWDSETMQLDFVRGGFDKNKVYESSYKNSKSTLFNFEGKYPSEANEYYRSLYVEGYK